MKIELMKEAHWPQVQDIYTEGINTGNATFEEYPPGTWQEWSQKHLASCSLVCVDDSKVVGWAAISLISSRSVYRGVGEVSVYISSRYLAIPNIKNQMTLGNNDTLSLFYDQLI